jgi:hypothetical protein
LHRAHRQTINHNEMYYLQKCIRSRIQMRKWDVIVRIIIHHDKLVKTIMIGQVCVYEFSGTFADTQRGLRNYFR